MKSDLKQTQDEVLRRVGRNLVIFQQIETLLKFLLSNNKFRGTPDNFKVQKEKRSSQVNKSMFGLLVDKYFTEVLQDAGTEAPEEEGDAGEIAFTFKISADSEFVQSMRRSMKLMTEQRNELVHSFLPRWEPESLEKLEETLAYLDTQREKVVPIHEHLLTIVNHMQEGYQKHAKFLASDEYQKQLELTWLQASPLVSFFRYAASEFHRKDGWCYLAQAGNLANKELPEEVKNLKDWYGFKTLKKLLLGSEIFDVFDEPLPNGGFTTLYKNKDEPGGWLEVEDCEVPQR